MDRYDTKTSPFLDTETPFTQWEAAKMAIMIITVIPRMVLGLIVLLIMALMSAIATLGQPLDQPLPPARRQIVECMKYGTRLVLICMGVHLRVKGWGNYLKARDMNIQLLVFNHISYLDAFGIVGLCAPSGLSKLGNAKIPVIGRIVRCLQNIYVPEKRQLASSKKNGNDRANARQGSISQLIAERVVDLRYPMLALAPEGTCGDGKCLIKFRTGAFVAGAPVLPMCISYSKKRHNPAWTIINEPVHFLRLLCQFYTAMNVTFLPPYIPSEQEKGDPAMYAENVRKTMANYLDIPLVDQSYNEFHALNRAKISTSWDASRVIAPPGVIDADGFVDLTAYVKKTD